MNSRCPWNELPNELLIRILAELDMTGLVACRRVCRSLHEVIEGTPELQYNIELHVTGMEDGNNKSLSIVNRLERLRAHHKAWTELKWIHPISLHLILSGTWELYGGLWASRAWDQKGISFMRMPSAFREIPMKQWGIEDIGFPIRDFTMDPSQDLLVLIELPTPDSHGDFPPCRIHLRSLSSGEPHPLAQATTLSHKPYLFDSAWRYIVQVMGNHVGVMFRCPEGEEGSEHELAIWNWRSGSLKMNRQGLEMESFAFLDDKLVVISLLTFDHDLPRIRCAKPVLCVTDFTRYSSRYRGDPNGNHICELSLPELVPGAFPSNMLIRADPAPSYSPGNTQEVPFHVGRKNRVFVLSFTAVSRRIHAPVTLFIPVQTLLDKYSEGRREIEWEHWGPRGTRMLGSLRASPTWVCYVYGSKFVHRSIHEEVEVYDFNALALRRLHAQAEVPANVRIVTEPSMFEHSSVFKEFVMENDNIITSAPYMVTTARLPDDLIEDPFAYVMLTEDNLFFIARIQGVRKCFMLTF